MLCTLPYFILSVNGVNNIKKLDAKTRIIKKQFDEIQILKNSISALEINAKEKEDLINSISVFQDSFNEILEDLKKQRDEYNKLINELLEMKNTMNEVVFKKKWRLIRFLMK